MPDNDMVENQDGGVGDVKIAETPSVPYPDIKMKDLTSKANLANDVVIFGSDGNFILAEEAPNNIPTRLKNVICHACDLQFISASVYETHVAGGKHQKKVKNMEVMKKLAKYVGHYSEDRITGILKCTVCKITINSPQLLAAHIIGSRHRNTANRVGLPYPPDDDIHIQLNIPLPDDEPPKKKKKKNKKSSTNSQIPTETAVIVPPLAPVNSENSESMSLSQFASLQFPTAQYPSGQYPSEQYPSEQFPPIPKLSSEKFGFVPKIGGAQQQQPEGEEEVEDEDDYCLLDMEGIDHCIFADGYFYVCEKCGTKCNSKVQIIQHLDSKKHADKLNKEELTGQPVVAPGLIEEKKRKFRGLKRSIGEELEHYSSYSSDWNYHNEAGDYHYEDSSSVYNPWKPVQNRPSRPRAFPPPQLPRSYTSELAEQNSTSYPLPIYPSNYSGLYPPPQFNARAPISPWAVPPSGWRG